MQLLDRMDDEGIVAVDVKREVMDEYNAALQDDPRRGRGVAGRVATATTACRRGASSRSGRDRCRSTAPARNVPTPTRSRTSPASHPRHPRRSIPLRRPALRARLRCISYGPPMEFGLTIPHTGRTRVARLGPRRTATVAEEAGWDSLWGVDHLVMPQHTDSEYTLGRKPAKIADDAVSGLLSPNYEMMTTLTLGRRVHRAGQARYRGGGAAHPQRGARTHASLATLDVYSGGRVALRRRRRVAPRGSRGDGHAVGPARPVAARSTSRCCARSGAPTATWWSSTASSTTSRRWTRSRGRCSGRSRSSSAATPTSRSSAPVASATAGSRRRCRPTRARRALGQGARGGGTQRARSRRAPAVHQHLRAQRPAARRPPRAVPRARRRPRAGSACTARSPRGALST